ncbi:MAG: YihA family ribosome biogenesis GTP-binding protein [Gammaproteobacteria bacterium]|nr:YihA family ribosome biogenesis GTP-binding protein [Gammaproteobacteria bacterium]
MNPVYRQARFISSAPDITLLPQDKVREIAFAGRSNAGKSSALNAITDQKQLARVSNTPGRTQMINLFELPDGQRLIDLPGYGYAKVPDAIKRHWQTHLQRYFVEREQLAGLILIMDIRHPLQDLDWQMIKWCAAEDVPLHILLTKADKLTYNVGKTTLLQVQRAIEDANIVATLQLFSATAKNGVDDVHEVLDAWFTGQRLV